MRSVYTRLCGILLLFSGLVPPVSAQQTDDNQKPATYTFIYRGEPITNALQQLVQKTNLDLIYDPAIIPTHTVFVKAKQKYPEDILRLILRDSGLDFIQLSSGTYVLTKAPAKLNPKGNLTGRVTDRRTGEPLSGANVMLADASGGAATGHTGVFKIPQLEKGYHEITIDYVGYKPVKDTVWVPANSTTSLNFSLASEPVLVEPIVIKGIRKQIPASRSFTSKLSSGQIINQQSLGTTDAVKSMNAISGIDFSLPLADFNIQGGGSGEHQLRLDGVPIYNPVSMGRMLGAFSPWSVKNIEVNKAGFSAPVGSQISGVVNIVQDVGHTQGSRFLLQANSMDLNSRFDHQFDIDGGPSINLMLAVRTNNWEFYQEPNMKQMLKNWDQLDPLLTLHLFQGDSSDTIFKAQDHSYDITYYDLHTVAEIEHNPFHQTRISAYHGKNRLETDLFSKNVALLSEAADLFYSFDNYDWTNTMAKIEHHWLANARLDANISGYMTSHSFDHNYFLTNNQQANIPSFAAPASDVQSELQQYAMESIETGDRNAMVQSSAKLDLNYSATKSYTLSGGLQATHLDYRFQLSDRYYNQARSDASSFLIAGYVQNDFLFTRKTSLSVGSRLTFVPSRDLVFGEPRLSLKHEAPNTSIGYLSAKLSGGIYRQFINQFDVSNVSPSSLVPSIRFWVPVDYTTTIPKSYHLAFDGLWEPTENWKFQVETYYKWVSRLILDYGKLSTFPFFNRSSALSQQQDFIRSTRGYAYGAGLSVQRTIPSLNMEVNGSYQYSRSRQKYPSRFGENYQPLPSSQPHQLDASVNWRLFSDLILLLQWQGVWGRSWGFRKAYYDYLSIREARTYGKYAFNDPGDDTLPRYSQLNAGVSYQFGIGASDLQIRMDIFNLLDHQNVIDRWLLPYQSKNDGISYELKERTMPGLRPSLSIKLNY